MIGKMAVFRAPTLKFQLSESHKLEEAKLDFRIRFLASKSDFHGDFGSYRASFFPQTRTELVKASAFRGRNSAKGAEREGLEATLNRLSKWLVGALLGATLIWRHDDESLWPAAGSLVDTILSIALKRILNQERPFPSPRPDPWMPSSHAQSIFYTFFFVILSIPQWLGVNEFTLIFSAAAITFGCYLSWPRVSQQFHTISQVVVGAAAVTLEHIARNCFREIAIFNVFVAVTRGLRRIDLLPPLSLVNSARKVLFEVGRHRIQR